MECNFHILVREERPLSRGTFFYFIQDSGGGFWVYFSCQNSVLDNSRIQMRHLFSLRVPLLGKLFMFITVCLGATQNLWVIRGQCELKIEVTKSLCPVYNSREKSVSPIQMINEKVLTLYKSFINQSIGKY